MSTHFSHDMTYLRKNWNQRFDTCSLKRSYDSRFVAFNPNLPSHPPIFVLIVWNSPILKSDDRTCTSWPDQLHTPTYPRQEVPCTLRLKRGSCVCLLPVWLCVCFMSLDKWGVLAAVSQLVKDRLPQSTVEALLCSWVALTMSSSAEVSGQ